MTSSRVDRLRYLVEKSAWDKLARLMRTAEREVFLSHCREPACSCDFLHDNERIHIEDRLTGIGLLQVDLSPTDKGLDFARFSYPVFKEVTEMEERIKLLKRLVFEQNWDALFSTLYSSEKETLMWISNPKEYNTHLSPEALNECVDSLVACDLVCRDAGSVSLSPDGVRFIGYMNYGINDSESKNFANCDAKYTKSNKDESTQDTLTVCKDCLEEAGKIVRGNREDTYGPAERNLSRIAEMWSAYLAHPVTPRQVAVMMVLLKVSRDAFKPKHDNMVDICGYAYLADCLDKDVQDC